MFLSSSPILCIHFSFFFTLDSFLFLAIPFSFFFHCISFFFLSPLYSLKKSNSVPSSKQSVFLL